MKPARRQPRFWAQIATIGLPMLLLAGFALRALYEDQRLQEDAVRREAAQLAPQVAAIASATLNRSVESSVRARQAWEMQVTRLLLQDEDTAYSLIPARNLVGLPRFPSDWTLTLKTFTGVENGDFLALLPTLLPPMVLWDPSSNAALPDPAPPLALGAPPTWWQNLTVKERIAWEEASRSKELPPTASTGGEAAVNALFEQFLSRGVGASEWYPWILDHGKTLSSTGFPITLAAVANAFEHWCQNPSATDEAALKRMLLLLAHRDTSMLSSELLERVARAFEGADATAIYRLQRFNQWLEGCRRFASKEWLDPLTHGTNPVQWIGGERARYLAWTVPTTPDPRSPRYTVFLSNGHLAAQLSGIDAWVRLPDWAGIQVHVQGVNLHPDTPGVTLASAVAQPPPEATGETVAVAATIVLAQPELVLERTRQRRALFGGLIIGSVVAAGLGLWHARRAFDRQHRLTEMQSGFVSSVSHELRTPIASIRLLAEGLDRGDGGDTEKQRDYSRFIVQECRRLTDLIENVLDQARIDQGRKDFVFEPIDLGRLLEDTARLMKPCAEAVRVRVELDLPCSATELPSPMWDGAAIQRVLVNLVDNAIKHSPPEARVVLSLRFGSVETQARSDECVLSVTDTGPGIPKKDAARIFEPFFRRGTELRRESRGIGIGLSLARHTVRAHQGEITVRSEPGMGCVFTVRLPMEPAARPRRASFRFTPSP